jgi:flagellar basal body-associated protein FliL
MNYMNDKKNMVVILIIIGILTATAIGMLLAVPSVLKSNTANLAGHSNNDTVAGMP